MTVTADDAAPLMERLLHADERLRRISQDERLLAVGRQLAGTDDVVMMQDMALLKPPGGGREPAYRCSWGWCSHCD